MNMDRTATMEMSRNADRKVRIKIKGTVIREVNMFSFSFLNHELDSNGNEQSYVEIQHNYFSKFKRKCYKTDRSQNSTNNRP